ncbi:hypothetical protein ACNJRW_21195 [Stenotrophomonas maltophilia]|uniref:hypothetical protein n=1 Tax=Stenotrophomonas maltophilia TaxID=40324 RepID=UPI0013DD7E50|nr:hypothetical protein [Stenotrophomonas maltophilia]HDS1676750.1 hypothetical protein [Stenotrophomonas maltophilia]HEL3814955.1 hypothetical protein [Stenotrophomonas maltophilia]
MKPLKVWELLNISHAVFATFLIALRKHHETLDPEWLRPPCGGPRIHALRNHQKKIAYRISSGIGTPSSHSSNIFISVLLKQ